VITAAAGLEDFFLEYDKRASGPYDMDVLAVAAQVAGVEFTGPPLRLR
jgi:hypothetical protein